MTPAERNLNVTVFRTTETAAIIINAMVKAAHGDHRSRNGRLEIAERQTSYLLELIRTTRLQVLQEQDNPKPTEDQP